MIVVRLNGGLGNQMFQFAAAFALSRRLGVECRADLSSFQRGIRRYELDCFTGPPGIAGDKDIPLSSRLTRFRVPSVLARNLGAALDRMKIFHQESSAAFIFNPKVCELSDNTYLDGYFQSEKYFSHIEREIRRIYMFRNSSDVTNEKMLDEIRATQAVSVHVRRGDYISNATTNRYHGTCSVEYYSKACRMLAERASDLRFFIFSDDSSWAEENIKPPARTVYVGHNKSAADYEDMRLMSNCRHHVIANSSFSWWAAWLNPSPEKIVIAPKRWVADTNVPTSDVLPDKWIAL